MAYIATPFEEYPSRVDIGTDATVERIVEIHEAERRKWAYISSVLAALSAAAATTVSPTVIASVTGVNAKTVANTVLFTPVPAGKTLIVTKVVIRCTAAVAITNGATIGIGRTAGTSDIFTDTNLAALTTTSNIFGFELYGMSVSVAAGGSVYLNLSVAATGTSQTLAVDLLGYYV